MHYNRPGFRKTHFLKKVNSLGFLGFGLYWVFGSFYLKEQLESLLVNQLHFYLELPVL